MFPVLCVTNMNAVLDMSIFRSKLNSGQLENRFSEGVKTQHTKFCEPAISAFCKGWILDEIV